MSLKKFEDYVKGSKIINPSLNKIKESAFLVGNDYKVKVVLDIPKSLVQEYINKVKEETDKNPLDNFSESEIAEQIVTFLIKQNLKIDNLTPEFTIGTEASSKNNEMDIKLEDAEEEISNDFDIKDKDFNEESPDSIINFKDEEPKKNEIKETTEDDSDFEEISINKDVDVNMTSTNNKPKTIGDLKKKDKKNDIVIEEETEEEEEIYSLYKKLGYNVGYHESLDINKIINNYGR